MAYLSTMLYQIHMQWIDPFRWCNLEVDIMRLVRTNVWFNQAQAFACAMDMGVNWHDGHTHVKH